MLDSASEHAAVFGSSPTVFVKQEICPNRIAHPERSRIVRYASKLAAVALLLVFRSGSGSEYRNARILS